MLKDTVPAFRFNRIQSLNPSALPSRHPSPHKSSDERNTAKPGRSAPNQGAVRAQAENREAVAADAERFLHQSKGSTWQPLGSSEWLQRAGLNIRKASDTQHLEAIALAYATYIRISASPLRAATMAELETLSGRKCSRTTTDLHLIVERFVSYGGETPAECLAARKLISRDVRAIRHLEAAKVLPSRVQALAATPGEGLHAWARQNAVAKQVRIDPQSARDATRQARSEARQRALVHEVTITTRRPDGSREARQRFKITGVMTAEVTSLQARLKGLAARSKPGESRS